jgi:hypothetical protein
MLQELRMERVRARAATLFRDNDNGGLRWLPVTLVMSVSILGGILRTAPRLPLNSFWAEDGAIFYSDALKLGVLESLLHPYAGYLHLVPRLLGAAAVAAPIAAAPSVIALEAATVCGLLAVVTLRASAGHITNRLVRYSLALFVAIQPIAAEVVLVPLANLQWHLMFAAFLSLLWKPRTAIAMIAPAVVCFLAAASSPFGVVLLPLAFLRMVALRDRRDAIIPGTLTIGTVLQIVVMMTAPSRELQIMGDPVRLGAWYLAHVVAPTVFGERLVGARVTLSALLLAALVVALLCLLWLVIGRQSRQELWPVVSVSVIYSLLFYAAPTVAVGLAAPRYTVTAALTLAFGIAVVVSRACASQSFMPSGRRTILATGVVWLLVAGVAVGWTSAVWTSRPDGPLWNESLRQAADDCVGTWLPQTTIPISPDGWMMQAPCWKVVRG